MKDRIYLDYGSSTPVDSRVLLRMQPYWQDCFAHPLSAHMDGEMALKALENAREYIGRVLHIEGSITEKELVFTSSGTESNTLALKGALEHVEHRRGSLSGLHILIGSIEHPSVREITGYALEKGMDVEYVPVTHEGIIDIQYIKTHIRPETVLISIQYVNSELGTIQPIEAISKIIRDFKREQGSHIFSREENVLYPLFHTDASQAFLWLPIDVTKLGVDMLTLDAHKMYGPKGIGLLYVKKGIPLKSIFLGSEGSYRPGTPAIPLIVGFEEAIKIGEVEREVVVLKVKKLQEYLIHELEESFPSVRINGSRIKRIASNVSFTFKGVNHEFLQVQLSEGGISVAMRSACLESRGEGSYVIEALGEEDKFALRITLGKETSKDHIDIFIKTLKNFISS